MPELCRFYGIVISMHFNDHAPPHFHARYGDDAAIFEIETARAHGRLPRRATSMIEEWASVHRGELREAWADTQQGRHPKRIAPLA